MTEDGLVLGGREEQTAMAPLALQPTTARGLGALFGDVRGRARRLEKGQVCEFYGDDHPRRCGGDPQLKRSSHLLLAAPPAAAASPKGASTYAARAALRRPCCNYSRWSLRALLPPAPHAYAEQPGAEEEHRGWLRGTGHRVQHDIVDIQ